MATCLVCGKTFEPKSAVQKYCSQDCQDEAHRTLNRELYRARSNFKPEVRSCVICGKKFLTRNGKQICCSSDCRKLYHKKFTEPLRRARDEPAVLATCPDCRNTRGKASALEIACEHCGKKFVPRNASQRFCCKKCGYLHRLNHLPRRCKPVKSLEQWQNEAAACGLSYGKYRCQIEHFGKTFEELKLS